MLSEKAIKICALSSFFILGGLVGYLIRDSMVAAEELPSDLASRIGELRHAKDYYETRFALMRATRNDPGERFKGDELYSYALSSHNALISFLVVGLQSGFDKETKKAIDDHTTQSDAAAKRLRAWIDGPPTLPPPPLAPGEMGAASGAAAPILPLDPITNVVTTAMEIGAARAEERRRVLIDELRGCRWEPLK